MLEMLAEAFRGEPLVSLVDSSYNVCLCVIHIYIYIYIFVIISSIIIIISSSSSSATRGLAAQVRGAHGEPAGEVRARGQGAVPSIVTVTYYYK